MRKALYACTLSLSVMCCTTCLMVHLPGAYTLSRRSSSFFLSSNFSMVSYFSNASTISISSTRLIYLSKNCGIGFTCDLFIKILFKEQKKLTSIWPSYPLHCFAASVSSRQLTVGNIVRSFLFQPKHKECCFLFANCKLVTGNLCYLSHY